MFGVLFFHSLCVLSLWREKVCVRENAWKLVDFISLKYLSKDEFSH